jgi:6-pyruvoyltetrahydropterin/6-carboxytetrahydropterin synthase
MTEEKLYITREVEFSAAHKLYREELSQEENYDLFQKCANPNGHGHNYLLEATFTGPVDPLTGMIVHFNEVKRLLDEVVIAPLDHRNLNTDVSFLQGVLPTSENVVRALWTQICHTIVNKSYRLYRLRLSSSAHHWVEYYGGVSHER